MVELREQNMSQDSTSSVSHRFNSKSINQWYDLKMVQEGWGRDDESISVQH